MKHVMVMTSLLAVSEQLLGLDAFALAAAGADEESGIPSSVGDVTTTLTETIYSIWINFIERSPYIAAALFILVFTWAASGLASKGLIRVLRDSDMRNSLKELLDRFISIGIWILGVLLAAMIVFPGLTPAKALGAMGIASIAVGFAFKDIFENFFAGVLILWRFPFEKGDYIECEGITGKVEDVQVRMTTVRLTSGELIVLPNSLLFKNPVKVLTEPVKRRIILMTGVAYDEDVDQSVEVIQDAVKNCGSVDDSKKIFRPSGILGGVFGRLPVFRFLIALNAFRVPALIQFRQVLIIGQDNEFISITDLVLAIRKKETVIPIIEDDPGLIRQFKLINAGLVFFGRLKRK